MPFYLNANEISFPNPYEVENEDGLIAVGGDLRPERIFFAYQLGVFPWFNSGDEILWWCLNPRFVLFPKDLRISKSMKKVLREQLFTFTKNHCFEEVMLRCMRVERKQQSDTWISEEMIRAYVALHEEGCAHSFEAWQNGELVGGFYGVQIGKVFCGESMFAEVSNASKAVFIDFVLKNARQFDVIDCQTYTEHLESLGAILIPKIEYLDILGQSSPVLSSLKKS